MNPAKQNYLNRIRSESAYPVYRSLIGLFVLIFYVLGGLVILGGLVTGLGTMFHTGFLAGVFVILISFVFGAIYIILAKFMKEAMLMAADLTDSITDLNSRYDQQPPR
jgi:hypothetical protein